jgi:hypothetical protein
MDVQPHNIETLLITFDLPLKPRYISSWRGAFVEMVGRDTDLLHNHNNSEAAGGLKYRYPLVQYKCLQGRAALLTINDGIDAVQNLLLAQKWVLNWQGKPTRLALYGEPMRQNIALRFDQPHRYHLQNYLPFNAANYERWQVCNSLAEKVELMERIIRGHVLSCLWGLGWNGKEEVIIGMQDIGNMQFLNFKGQNMLSFDLIFDTNASLPSGLGLGKASSTGFGVLTQL